jgi:hypothetical protein
MSTGTIGSIGGVTEPDRGPSMLGRDRIPCPS